jgi:5-methylcytosine-specific restriction protein A
VGRHPDLAAVYGGGNLGALSHMTRFRDKPSSERFIPRDQRAPRLRGRKAVKERARRLAGKLCEDCQAKGIRRAAEVPDHRRPLALGGSDTDDNIRCLCKPCHEQRTREQFGYREKVMIDSATGWPE